MERKRQPDFTDAEMEVLTQGVENREKLLFGKLGGANMAAMKQRGWQGVTN